MTDEELAKLRRYLAQEHAEVGGLERITPRATLSTAEIGAIRTVYFAEQLLAEVDALRELLAAMEQREQTAHTIFTRVLGVNFKINERQRERILDQARAWLANAPQGQETSEP